MLSELDQILQKALQELETAQDESGLESWRIAHLGRSASLMLLFDQLGKINKEERPAVGG
jgi:phenylalanyl-tRNA synthetase alpha chain